MNILDLLKYFPDYISSVLEENLKDKEEENNTLEEIRFRTDKPIILKFNGREKIIDHIVMYDDIIEILQYICDNSIYSYQNQICNGYITIRGGHRIGVVGSSIIEKNRVINMNYISSLNFRIAKQIIGCSNKILKYVLKPDDGNIYNTIIISPPGSRKNNNIKRSN